MKRLILLAIMGLCVSATAQRVISLNNASADSLRAAANIVLPQKTFNEAKISRPFAMNPVLKIQDSIAVGDIIDLQLFTDKNYTAIVSSIIPYDVDGNFTITFKLAGYSMAYGMITTNTLGKSLFTLNLPEENQIFTSRSSIYSDESYLLEIDESSMLKDADDGKDIPQGIPMPIENNENEREDEGNNNQENSLDSGVNYAPAVEKAAALACTPSAGMNDPAQINVLFVYTPAALSWANSSGGGISNVIAGTMAQSRAVLANQGNGDTIICVYSQQVAYTEFDLSNMNTDLDRLTELADGYLDTVHQLRKQYNADIVALIAVNNGVGGLGWVLNDSVNGNIANGFNVIRVQQIATGTTSIHEIGHNLSMRHEAQNNSGTPLFPYGLGWFWTGSDSKVYGSVMSYTGIGAPYFSNPNVNHMGAPTGTANANNAQVFRKTKHVVAFYKDKLPYLPEVPVNLMAVNPTNNGATFRWDSCANAIEYRVCVPISGGGYSYYTITKTSHTVNYNLWFPSACTSYDFFIIAINACGDQARSATCQFTTSCSNDPTVTTVSASNIAATTATLNSTVNANGASISEQGYKYKKTTESIWKTTTTGNITGLTPTTQYQFYAYAKTAGVTTFIGSTSMFTTAAEVLCQIPITYYADTICQGAFYTDDNFTNLTKDSIYYDTLKNINNCDSIVCLTLRHYPSVAVHNYSDTICENGTYSDIYFQNLTVANTYKDTLHSVHGCDSLIVILNLSVVKPPDTVYISASICKGETYSQNGFIETISGTYTQNLITRAGCDSVIVLSLTVFEIGVVRLRVKNHNSRTHSNSTNEKSIVNSPSLPAPKEGNVSKEGASKVVKFIKE